MKKEIKIILLAVALLAVIAGGVFWYWYQEIGIPMEKEKQEALQKQNQLPQESIDISKAFVIPDPKNALLLITFASDDLGTFEAEVKDGMTAFDLLKQGVKALGLDFQSKDYGEMGVLVEKIGDKKNGDDGKYWMYYINGALAQVAANKQELKAGDKVEFKFEKSNF